MTLYSLSDSEMATLRTQCLVMAQATCGSPIAEEIIAAAKAFEAYVLGEPPSEDNGPTLSVVA